MYQLLVEWKEAAPAAGALTAILSALVALGVFRYTRGANRRRATLDMVLKTFIDESGRARYNAFKDVMTRHKNCEDPLDIIQFADPDSPPSTDKQSLRDQVNEYELIALGIRRGIFDEKIYKLWFGGQFVRDFDSLQPYLNRVWEKRPSVFCEFVYLAERWKKRPHPENSPHRIKLAWWGITRNDAKLKAFTNADC